MDGIKVRVRLAGSKVYERPVSLPLGEHLPHIGDLIEVSLLYRVVRAQVTSVSPPICRGGAQVEYYVYASEIERTKGNPPPHPL